MGTGRSIGSIILTGIGGGSKLLAKTWWSLRKGRSEVKKSARTFYETLRKVGIPEEAAKEITVAYAKPALDILGFRKIFKLLMEMDGEDKSIRISI